MNLPASAGDRGSIPDPGRSLGERNGNALQYSCLGNPMDRGAWRATVLGVTKSWTRLSTHVAAYFLLAPVGDVLYLKSQSSACLQAGTGWVDTLFLSDPHLSAKTVPCAH